MRVSSFPSLYFTAGILDEVNSQIQRVYTQDDETDVFKFQ